MYAKKKGAHTYMILGLRMHAKLPCLAASYEREATRVGRTHMPRRTLDRA